MKLLLTWLLISVYQDLVLSRYINTSNKTFAPGLNLKQENNDGVVESMQSEQVEIAEWAVKSKWSEKSGRARRAYDYEEDSLEEDGKKLRNRQSRRRQPEDHLVTLPVLLIFVLIVILCIAVVVIEANFNILDSVFHVLDSERSVDEQLRELGLEPTGRSRRKRHRSKLSKKKIKKKRSRSRSRRRRPVEIDDEDEDNEEENIVKSRRSRARSRRSRSRSSSLRSRRHMMDCEEDDAGSMQVDSNQVVRSDSSG